MSGKSYKPCSPKAQSGKSYSPPAPGKSFISSAPSGKSYNPSAPSPVKSFSPSAPPPYSVTDPYMPYTHHRAPTPPYTGNTATTGVPNPGDIKTSNDTASSHCRYSSTGRNKSDGIPTRTPTPMPLPVPSPVENTTPSTYTPHSQAPATAFQPYTPSPASAYPAYTPSQPSAFQPYAAPPSSAFAPYSSYPHAATPYPYGYGGPSTYSPYAPTVIVSLPNQTPPSGYGPYQVPGLMQGDGTVVSSEESFEESVASSCKMYGSDYAPHYHSFQGYHPLIGYHHLPAFHHHHHHNSGNY